MTPRLRLTRSQILAFRRHVVVRWNAVGVVPA